MLGLGNWQSIQWIWCISKSNTFVFSFADPPNEVREAHVSTNFDVSIVSERYKCCLPYGLSGHKVGCFV